jgi:hypothetical protein
LARAKIFNSTKAAGLAFKGAPCTTLNSSFAQPLPASKTSNQHDLFNRAGQSGVGERRHRSKAFEFIVDCGKKGGFAERDANTPMLENGPGDGAAHGSTTKSVSLRGL